MLFERLLSALHSLGIYTQAAKTAFWEAAAISSSMIFLSVFIPTLQGGKISLERGINHGGKKPSGSTF